MSGVGAWKVLGWGATALAVALTQGACGTGGHAREGAGAGGTGATGGTGAGGTGATSGAGAGGVSATGGAGAGGMGATGGAGAPGGSGPSMAGTSGAGSAGASCSSVGQDVVIATFDEGAVIVERNYPIATGAMPGGTYAYGDPLDSTMAFAASVVAEGHQCSALAMSITGSSFRGMGFWSNAAVDATSYTGVAFWARRGTGSTDPTGLVVSLGLEAVTVATDAGGTGTCMGADADCNPPQVTITLTDTWTRYALYWSMFTPGSAVGTAVPASGDHVNGLDFSFQLAGAALETTVLELDDLVFLTSSP